MVFPHNIDNILKVSKKSSEKDKFSVFITILIIADTLLYFFFGPMLQEVLGLPSYLLIMFMIILNLIVGIIVFRVFIIKESDKLKEDENSKDDSLSRFYFIREKDIPKVIDGIEVFENVDGNFFVCLQVFYGPNDKNKSKGTLVCFANMYNLFHKYCIDFRTYVAKEKFSNSIECKRFLNSVNSIEDQMLSKAMLEISDLVLDFTETKGELYSTYVIIRMTPFQINGLVSLKNELNTLIYNEIHSIRNVEFLGKKQFRDFIRDYYNLEALDMSNLRNPKASNKLLRKYGKTVYKTVPNNFGFNFKTGVKTK